jgi:photosystem I subunit 9
MQVISLCVINHIQLYKEFIMKDFTTYLSTAPVLTIVSVSFVASLLIEINRYFPDALIFAF